MPSRAPTATRHSSPGSSRRGARHPRLFFALALDDVRRAADVLATTYIVTAGADGFVSFECTPDLADDTEATIAQARDLWARLQRPNTMVKVPATAAGVPAIERLTADGVNVNVTLLFSVDRYQQVIDAYTGGLERACPCRLARRSDFASVASFFVSRVDTKVDARSSAGSDLRGRAAIANAALAFDTHRNRYREPTVGGDLAAAGARPQRPLWASTGTKNDAYSDVLYVESLIAPGVVNTMPRATLEAFADHGTVTDSLTRRDPRRTHDPRPTPRRRRRPPADHRRTRTRRHPDLLRLLRTTPLDDRRHGRSPLTRLAT